MAIWPAETIFVSKAGAEKDRPHQIEFFWRSPASGRELRIDIAALFRDVPHDPRLRCVAIACMMRYHHHMRTTVDIESGLLKRLRREALRRQVAFKHLLNRLLREGLDTRPAVPAQRYQCPTFAMGTPTPPLNLDKALALAATLEDVEIARELQLRK